MPHGIPVTTSASLVPKTWQSTRWLPLVGVLPDLPRACFAVGLGGRGLAWAFVVAERLVELALHDADPGLFSAVRLG